MKYVQITEPRVKCKLMYGGYIIEGSFLMYHTYNNEIRDVWDSFRIIKKSDINPTKKVIKKEIQKIKDLLFSEHERVLKENQEG